MGCEVISISKAFVDITPTPHAKKSKKDVGDFDGR